MTTVGGKEKDVWGRPCSCQGLNPSCFKCGGFGMLREPPVVPKFYESTRGKSGWSKSGKSFVIDAAASSPQSGAKKTQNKKAPEKSPLPTIWTEPYYCLKCKQFLTNRETIGHGHMDKVLYKPFLDYMAKPKPNGAANQNAGSNSKVNNSPQVGREVKETTQLVWKESYYCSQCKKYLKPFQLFDHSQHVDKILQKPKSIPTPKLQKGKS